MQVNKEAKLAAREKARLEAMSRAQEISKKAKEVAEREFSVEKMASAYNKVYETALSGEKS